MESHISMIAVFYSNSARWVGLAGDTGSYAICIPHIRLMIDYIIDQFELRCIIYEWRRSESDATCHKV